MVIASVRGGSGLQLQRSLAGGTPTSVLHRVTNRVPVQSQQTGCLIAMARFGLVSASLLVFVDAIAQVIKRAFLALRWKIAERVIGLLEAFDFSVDCIIHCCSPESMWVDSVLAHS